MGSRLGPPSPKSSNLTAKAKAALANRERAYIAASRRKDRSDEARLESALRGSEIHKELTGKALIVTRDIVMNGGEYLEEDPTFDRLLARRQQGPSSPTMFSNPVLERWTNQSNQLQFVNGFMPTMNTAQTSPILTKLTEHQQDSSPQDSATPIPLASSPQLRRDSMDYVGSIPHNFQQYQQTPSDSRYTSSISASSLSVSAPISEAFDHTQWAASNDDFGIPEEDGMALFTNQPSSSQESETDKKSTKLTDMFTAQNNSSLWRAQEDQFMLDNESIRF